MECKSEERKSFVNCGASRYSYMRNESSGVTGTLVTSAKLVNCRVQQIEGAERLLTIKCK